MAAQGLCCKCPYTKVKIGCSWAIFMSTFSSDSFYFQSSSLQTEPGRKKKGQSTKATAMAFVIQPQLIFYSLKRPQMAADLKLLNLNRRLPCGPFHSISFSRAGAP